MKILIIIPSYKPAQVYGGPIEAVSNLAESLTRKGESVTVYTTNANGTTDLDVECGKEILVDGVHVFYFKRKTGGHSNYSPKLLKALRQTATTFDVIHIQSWWNLVTMPSARICLARNVKPIISPRGTLTSYTFQHRNSVLKQLFHKWAGKRLLEKSTLLYTSQQERMEAEKFIRPASVFVLPNIHVFPKLTKGDQPKKDHLDVIFLGRIDPAKNIEYLLTEFSTYLKIPYRLVIAGEGEPSYVTKLKDLFKSNSAVIWAGRVDGIRKYEMLASSDLLVLPSHTENYGNVILESLSQGTPVLISDKVGLKEYVNSNQLGWIRETKAGDWSKLLHELWHDRSILQNIRLRAQDCISRDFNSQEDVSRYVEMYSTNLSKHV